MSRKKSLILCAAIAAAIIAIGTVWYVSSHVFLDGVSYSRNAKLLDLQDKTITLQQFETLQAELPDCEILWNVPMEKEIPSSVQNLYIDTLTDTDIPWLGYFPYLQTIHVSECGNYPQLMAAMEAHPDVEVFYQVPIGGTLYPQDTQSLVITNVSDEDLELILYLPELTRIDATGCSDYPRLLELKERYPHIEVNYSVSIGGTKIAQDETELKLGSTDPKELLEKLGYLPNIRSVQLTQPKADYAGLAALVAAYPEIEFHWELEVLGISISTEDTHVDFSGAEFDSIEEIELAMRCFPKLETVYLGECGIDNEILAAYRERVRQDYKVVWMLRLGLMPVRTDDLYFMPAKEDYYVTDKQMDLLVYCEDLICVDVGHYQIRRCEWAAHLPKLRYLIIADAPLVDIKPLAGLKELVFLELFLTDVTDYTPLLELKNLEDLNLSFCYGDPEPLKQMTWLKRLWWADAKITEEEYQQYLPDTELMFMQNVSSTGLGWREGQHYYDMRDLMGMEYMYH